MSQKALAHSIARVAVEVVRDYARSQGDTTLPVWEETSAEAQARAVRDVELYLADADAHLSSSHAAWRNEQIADGWTYGPAYDAEKKTNPKIVPYTDLPAEVRTRDWIFRGVVHAIAREQMR